MRASLLPLTLAVLLGCAAAKGVEDPVTLTTLARGQYAADVSGRRAVLAKNIDEYHRLWSELVADGDAPEVHLDGKAAVFLLAGQRNTGGWSIDAQGVTLEDGTAVIHAKVVAPARGAIVSQALTSPWAIVLVHSDGVEKVRWAEE